MNLFMYVVCTYVKARKAEHTNEFLSPFLLEFF